MTAAYLLFVGLAAFCVTNVAGATGDCYCTGWGDPHYTTYDGNAFDFYGMCKYLLTGNTDPSNGKPLFEVYGKNVPWTGNPARSVTEYVEVKYCGQVIRLGPGLTATLIDPNPGVIDPACFTVSTAGGVIYITTDFGLKVGYKPQWRFYIWTPECFRNLLTGICGDCNSDPGNDLTDPQDVTDNYLVYDPDATNEECIADPLPCDPKEPPFVNLNMFCGFLLPGNYNNNPFTECLERLGPKVVASFYRDCVVDVTAGGCSSAACEALMMVIGECMALGFYVDPVWTELTGCRECPPHVKSREEALTPTDAECHRQPTEGLVEYIFCEDSCAKPEYTCQLKKEFQDGLIYEICEKQGLRSVIPFARPARFNCEPCTCECDESRLTLWQVRNQVPSILCSVVDVALELDMEFYHVCSGSCQNNWMCRGSGEVVGRRYLKCEGVKEVIEQQLYMEGVKCDCERQTVVIAQLDTRKIGVAVGDK